MLLGIKLHLKLQECGIGYWVLGRGAQLCAPTWCLASALPKFKIVSLLLNLNFVSLSEKIILSFTKMYRELSFSEVTSSQELLYNSTCDRLTLEKGKSINNY